MSRPRAGVAGANDAGGNDKAAPDFTQAGFIVNQASRTLYGAAARAAPGGRRAGRICAAEKERPARPLGRAGSPGDLMQLVSRVFLPLCGKTRDIHWLLSHGYRVSGSELSKIAVEQLFSELGIEPNITAIDQISRYSSNNVDIFVGDIFSLSRGILGQIDAIYDRAALAALPEPMRDRYAAHLLHSCITRNTLLRAKPLKGGDAEPRD